MIKQCKKFPHGKREKPFHETVAEKLIAQLNQGTAHRQTPGCYVKILTRPSTKRYADLKVVEFQGAAIGRA